MKIELNEDRRREFTDKLQSLFRDDFDEPLSAFRAEEVLDIFLKMLGPSVYNQAVQDVRAHLQSKLDDLDGDVYLTEED